MTQTFDASTGLIFVDAEISGPRGRAGARLVLDTGATTTLLNVNLLKSVGYDFEASTDFARMATGSGVQLVPRIVVTRLSALGRHVIGARVLAHDLPEETAVDGLLGLDFFRDTTLNIDFRSGSMSLT